MIHTIFIGHLNMKKEKLETRSIRANDFVQSPIECSYTAYRRVGIAFESRLVHRHHYASWLTAPARCHFCNHRVNSEFLLSQLSFLVSTRRCETNVGYYIGFKYFGRVLDMHKCGPSSLGSKPIAHILIN